MARSLVYDVTLDGEGLILARDGIDVQRVQANPFAMKSSSGERNYGDLDEWAIFQVDTMHRGVGSELYGDPEEYWYGCGLDTRFKNKVFLGPQAQSLTMPASKTGDVHYGKFGSKLFMSVGTEVYELVTTTWTLRETLTATCTGLCEFNGYLYAAQGTANTIRKTADGTTWTDVGGTPAGFRLYVHGGYLYRSVNQVLYYSADPDAGAPTWSSAIYVGDSQYVVQSMLTFGDALIVFKNDGGWKIPGNPGEYDAAYEIGELKWRDSIDARSGVKCCVWSDGFLYVTWGKAGLLRWTGKTVSTIGLDIVTAGPVVGRIWDLMPTANFLYAQVGRTNAQACWIVAWNGSGWHTIAHQGTEGRGAYYFDSGTGKGGEIYTTTYHASDVEHKVYKFYLPGEIGDPTTENDSAYKWETAGALTNYLYTPKFTANMHSDQKEFRQLIVWAENIGTAGVGTQTIRFDYRIDSQSSGDWIQLVNQTIEADVNSQKSYIVDFPTSSFADKTITSVSVRTVTLATGSTADMSAGEWVYFVDTNEYRMIKSVTDATHFELQCPLDGSPSAGSTIRQGIPWGRYIQFRISMTNTVNTRTPVLRAFALKYLVNIKDYDIWQATVLIADPRQLRNGNNDHTPIATQLARINEIRKKGRVTFVDEVGDSHTVKVSNYSLQPIRQRTDKADVPATEYWAKITLLEV